jgi:hypothetical protein
MLENEYSTLILFSFSTKNRAIGLALLTLVLLFYTPGTERQNKLHPYEDVKSNNFSVCKVFIPYVILSYDNKKLHLFREHADKTRKFLLYTSRTVRYYAAIHILYKEQSNRTVSVTLSV